MNTTSKVLLLLYVCLFMWHVYLQFLGWLLESHRFTGFQIFTCKQWNMRDFAESHLQRNQQEFIQDGLFDLLAVEDKKHDKTKSAKVGIEPVSSVRPSKKKKKKAKKRRKPIVDPATGSLRAASPDR